MPVTSSPTLTNSKPTGKRQQDPHLPAGKRIRFSEKNEIFETFEKGTLDHYFENARQSNDFKDRQILGYAAKNRFPEYAPEQLTAIRTALTSSVSMDQTVLQNTLDTLENNHTNPNAKKKIIDLLSNNPGLRKHSIFWDPYTMRIDGIDLKPPRLYRG